jgi:DNA-directed RNA polymerase subunit RPC12/RpoP
MEEPTNLCEAASMLTQVFVFMRKFQSNLVPRSQMRSFAGKSCESIDDAIRLIESAARANATQSTEMEIGTPCPKPNLHLDFDIEKARALHRVWRALNDGDCPSCHRAVPATSIVRDSSGMECPNCGFHVTFREIDAIEVMFAPAMNAALEIFEEWRATACE